MKGRWVTDINLAQFRKNIFLLDALGALTSSVLLAFVLPRLNVGLLEQILFMLAFFAALFFCYSLSCFLLNKKAQSIWLKVIMVANLLYCILTGFVVVKHGMEISLIGLIYFIGEMLLILALVGLEYYLANQQEAP